MTPTKPIACSNIEGTEAPYSVIEVATKLEHPLCARYIRTSPARPTNPYRTRELGHTVATDF